MLDQLASFMVALAKQTDLAQSWWGNVVMIGIGIGMIYLAVAPRNASRSFWSVSAFS